jgi:ABC-type uncharacterized transport system YnjBCD permease subunit
MNDKRSHRGFAEALISQEVRMTPERLEDHRRRLSHKIAVAQTRERRMRIALSVALFLFLGLTAVWFVVQMLAPRGVFPLKWLFTSLTADSQMLATLIFWVVFGTSVSVLACFGPLYWLWYGRRPRQARDDYMLLMLSELQREVDDLKNMLNNNQKE